MTGLNNTDFRDSIPEYSDEEILKILIKRKQYQPEAADLAVQEAIRRRLINSEQDLFEEEFQETPASFQLFPFIEKKEIRIKIRKSIARALLIVGVIPFVWGVLKITESNLFEGILLILLGGIWIFAAGQIMSGVVSKMVGLLFVMLFASVAYIVKLFLGMKGLSVMDFAVPVILVLFITYGLLFIKRLRD